MKILSVVFLFAANAFAAAPPAPAPAKEVRMPAASLKWEKPMGDAGPEMAFVKGDAKTGPFQMFLRLKNGGDTGWHTHDAAYSAVVVSGTWMHLEQGETTAAELPAGSFWTEGAKVNHDDRCVSTTPCTIFINSVGAQTFYPKTADGKDVPPKK